MPDASDYDLEFRPESYFDIEHAVSKPFMNIKGEQRRQIAKQLHEGTEEGMEDLDDESKRTLFAEALTEPDRQFVGSVHPQLMGGEYLPDLGEQEVEIARVVLDSTTGDVFSIRAEARDDLLRYRIVSEYLEGEEIPPMRYERMETQLPLTMGELIRLIDSVKLEGEEQLGKGLTNTFRNPNYDGNNAEQLVDFVRVESEFYPDLEAYYKEEAREWLELLRWHKSVHGLTMNRHAGRVIATFDELSALSC